MTVKELIIELLSCNMESEVTLEVYTQMHEKYSIANRFIVIDYVGGVVIEEEKE